MVFGQGPVAGAGVVHGVGAVAEAAGGLDVFADALGVDEPVRYSGGLCDAKECDRLVGSSRPSCRPRP